jgi:uncharacterized membrane protein
MTLDLPIHPIIVHFPIALLSAGFLVDLAGRAMKIEWLGKAALLMLVTGALGTIAATRSGSVEEDRILQTPAIHETLEEHEDGGKMTMWIFLGLAAARLAFTWRRKFGQVMGWLFLVLWAAGLVLLVETAHHGGQLVYIHGAGISAAPPSPD